MKSNAAHKNRIRADIILIAAALLIALAAYVFVRSDRHSGAVAAVYVNGEKTAEYPLDTDTTVKLESPNGGYNILVIKDGAADITEASCPDGICVETHAAQYEGDTIICLPNKTEIRIEGGESSEVDMVS